MDRNYSGRAVAGNGAPAWIPAQLPTSHRAIAQLPRQVFGRRPIFFIGLSRVTLIYCGH